MEFFFFLYGVFPCFFLVVFARLCMFPINVMLTELAKQLITSRIEVIKRLLGSVVRGK